MKNSQKIFVKAVRLVFKFAFMVVALLITILKNVYIILTTDEHERFKKG